MKLRAILASAFLTLSFLSHAATEGEEGFWEHQPKELAERYEQASALFNEDWVLDFADSLDVLGKFEHKFHFYAAELKCHHAFNERDSLNFFKYSEDTRNYALEYKEIPLYFGELFNVCSFYINTGHNHEAQTSAQFLISEAGRLDFPKGAYYGYYTMGALYSGMGLHTQAIGCFNKAVDIIADDEKNIYGVAQMYELIANEHLESRDYDKAIETGLKAQNTADTGGDINATLALAYYNKGDFDAFRKACKEYLGKANSSIAYGYYYGYLTCLLNALDGNYDEAQDIADTMDEETRWELKSEICKMKGDWKGAYDFSTLANNELASQRDSLMFDEIEQLGSDISEMSDQYDQKRQDMRKHYIIAIIILFLVACALLAIVNNLKNRAVLRHKEKELEISNRYMMMVENAPLGYSRAKLIFDTTTGKVVDYRTEQVNSKLRESIEAAGVKVGEKTIVESYPVSGPFIISKINESVEQNLSCVRFTLHLKEFHQYYETIILFDSKDYISILSLNTTDTVRAKKDAVEANKVKTRFIQNMSHEIRTPLNAIVGFSQLLALPGDFVNDEERQEYSGYIANNSEMLMMLINDILDISDADSGRYKMNLSEVSCNKVARFAMKAVEYRVASGVELKFSSDVDDDFMVKTDARRVEQVLINYLTNACKNTSKGSIEVGISTTENPGRVTFSVTDTGIGVPPEMAEEIFERFKKLDEFKQGAGLGLNICKNIANELGAIVTLDKEYHNGARFLLII